MGNDSNRADFDWLYRRESSSPDPDPVPTAVMPDLSQRRPHQVRTGPTDPGSHPLHGERPPHIEPPVRSRACRGKAKGRRIVTILTLLVLGWIAFIAGTPIYAWNGTETIPVSSGSGETHPGTTILLVGSDGRRHLTPEQRGELGTGDENGARTDTMLLLYIPPNGKSALISLPRDSYLPIPGHGKNKLNAAYAFGGAPLLVQTIEQNTNVRIDGYLEVGFLGIVDAVNALGGIEICLPSPIKDKDSHLDLPAGCQTLDGKNALGYVRMRKADPTGDIGRMNRQREMIGLIAKKAASPSVILNPSTYWKLNMALRDNLTRGDGTTISQATSAALSFRAISSGDGFTLTVPVAQTDAKTPAGSAVLWDGAKAKELFGLINSGTTDGMDRFVK